MSAADSTFAIVPVKRFAEAKTRLSNCLSAQQRAEFSYAMLDDVLHAVAMTSGIDGVMVVSNEPSLAPLRHCHGFEWLRESGSEGLNTALTEAAATLTGRGVEHCCILPADLPLARPEALENLLASHHLAANAGTAVTLVPDRSQHGTNAMVCSQPAAMQFRFGGASFAAHRAWLASRSITTNIFYADGLALDIDTETDLRCLRRHYRMSEQLTSSTTESLIQSLAATCSQLPDGELPRRTA